MLATSLSKTIISLILIETYKKERNIEFQRIILNIANKISKQKNLRQMFALRKFPLYEIRLVQDLYFTAYVNYERVFTVLSIQNSQ